MIENLTWTETIRTLSINDIEGSLDSTVVMLQKLKEECAKPIRSKLHNGNSDDYRKFKYSNLIIKLEIDPNYGEGDITYFAIIGTRPLHPSEIKYTKKKQKRAEERAQKERQRQFQELKKEFEKS